MLLLAALFQHTAVTCCTLPLAPSVQVPYICASRPHQPMSAGPFCLSDALSLVDSSVRTYGTNTQFENTSNCFPNSVTLEILWVCFQTTARKWVLQQRVVIFLLGGQGGVLPSVCKNETSVRHSKVKSLKQGILLLKTLTHICSPSILHLWCHFLLV